MEEAGSLTFSRQLCPDGHFDDFVAEMPRDEEHFRVEAESGGELAAENFARGAALEQLEAALRVPEGQPGEYAQQQVESTAAMGIMERPILSKAGN